MSELFSRPSSRRRTPRRGFDDREEKPPSNNGGLFGWTIFILLLVGLVALCWMGTIYVFGHPETPLGYSVLQKFKKVEAPKRFSEVAAPKGEFLNATKLLERYNTMTPHQLKKESERLLRNFIRNYQTPEGLVPYVTGRFSILDSFELSKSDFIQAGVVALAHDVQAPNVLIENIYPTDAHKVQATYRSLLTGVVIPITRSTDLAPVIHIERLPDGRLKFTTIPIQYRDYTSSQGPGGFSLEPPPSLNVEAGLPILSNARVLEADQHYATYRHKEGAPDASGNAPPATSLMPVLPAVTAAGRTPEPISLPAIPVPTPKRPAPVVVATPLPASQATPVPVLAAIPVHGTPPPVAANPGTVGTDEPLKPFLSGKQPTVATTSGGQWPTYKPGQMPRGRLIGVEDARGMASADVSSQPTYLSGEFVVTAAVGNSAVLRRSADDPIRVVVQYPSGSRPPDQGANVSRAGDRPFLITNIRETPDGQVNIYVREVTSE